jgi:hypothetical protein
MACERCHGAAQEGMVGPSLVNSLKVLSKDQFKTTVLQGTDRERHAQLRRQQDGESRTSTTCTPT